ncbi:MAG: hypothetical protein CVV37_03180 [Nitrospira bacterium HGW-Nitrospira-1]|nr:MAG: hypothetical protein CVV37_03180 [Nitrospira bacterium HGW-Nitrospira-1]
MKKTLIYSITFISLLLFVFIPVTAKAADDFEGYDENTEITIKGSVSEVVLTRRGPVILIVDYKNKPLRVLTAPRWHLIRNNIEFQGGAEVEITGSKFYGKDGNFYLVARKIKFLKDDRVIELRDAFCRPMWKGMR